MSWERDFFFAISSCRKKAMVFLPHRQQDTNKAQSVACSPSSGMYRTSIPCTPMYNPVLASNSFTKWHGFTARDGRKVAMKEQMSV